MTTTLEQIELDRIDTHAGNPRRDLGDLTELAASIESQGILEPLIVAPHVDPVTDTEFVLLAGHRRLAAAQMLALADVPCIVRGDLTDPAAQLEAMLVENLQRTDLTPVEEATAYQQLLDFPGYNVQRISKATGRSRGTVKARLGLAKLPETVRAKLHAGQVTLADAAALVEFAGDPDTCAGLERALGTSNWSYYLQRARNERSARRDRDAIRKGLNKVGVRVVTRNELDELDATAAADDGWVYVDPEGDLDDLRQTPEFHASCPGHAALLEQRWQPGGKYKWQAVYVCTQPELHPEIAEQVDPDETEQDRAERAAAEAKRVARAELEANLATAATVRRAHLRAVGEAIEPGQVSTLLAHAIADMIGGVEFRLRVVRGILDEDAIDKTNLEARLAVAPLGVQAVILDALTNVDDELEQPSGWPRHGAEYNVSRTEAWRQRLVDLYGYEWSDVEAEANTEPPPAIVDVNLPDHDVTASEMDEQDDEVDDLAADG